MGDKKTKRRLAMTAILSMAALWCGAMATFAQAPVKTHLRRILVLDKSQGGANGHLESRRDLNAALNQLSLEKGFAITFISQTDPASKIATEFSPASLATYQAVLFSSNDGVDKQLDAASKANLEAYVQNGGGFVPIHAASAFISNWPWLTSVLVESFFSPFGNNQPTANVAHDTDGTKEGKETKGIFKGLTAPSAFLDEHYSFRASPRGRPGVTILLTVDEKSFSKTINGPMGDDHPIAWAKTEGMGRVAHISMGHSWSTSNVYTAKNGYLKYFLYGAMRYVAGDFVGCTDNRYKEYNEDVTKSDTTACKELIPTSIVRSDGMNAQPLISKEAGRFVRVDIHGAGPHSVSMLDVSGRVVQVKQGVGPSAYSLSIPVQSGIYTVVAKSRGETTRYRVTVL